MADNTGSIPKDVSRNQLNRNRSGIGKPEEEFCTNLVSCADDPGDSLPCDLFAEGSRDCSAGVNLSHLRHALLARRIEGEDPGAVEKRRRRHLPIIGELLA